MAGGQRERRPHIARSHAPQETPQQFGPHLQHLLEEVPFNLVFGRPFPRRSTQPLFQLIQLLVDVFDLAFHRGWREHCAASL